MNQTCHDAFAGYSARTRANDALDSYQVDQRESLWLDLIQSLGAYSIKVLGHLRGTLVVDVTSMGCGDLWTICDNGGELNVERINAPETLRSVPYTAHRTMLDGATMAYRVRCVIDDKPIDYACSLADCAEEIRAAQGPNA